MIFQRISDPFGTAERTTVHHHATEAVAALAAGILPGNGDRLPMQLPQNPRIRR